MSLSFKKFIFQGRKMATKIDLAREKSVAFHMPCPANSDKIIFLCINYEHISHIISNPEMKYGVRVNLTTIIYNNVEYKIKKYHSYGTHVYFDQILKIRQPHYKDYDCYVAKEKNETPGIFVRISFMSESVPHLLSSDSRYGTDSEHAKIR